MTLNKSKMTQFNYISLSYFKISNRGRGSFFEVVFSIETKFQNE